MWQHNLHNDLLRSLTLLLTKTAAYECKEPQDKICALLRLHTEDLSLGSATVDVRSPNAAIYRDFATQVEGPGRYHHIARPEYHAGAYKRRSEGNIPGGRAVSIAVGVARLPQST